jgi:hypothetical protein
MVDNLRLAEWQVQALSLLPQDTEFILLNCTNSSRNARPLKHGLYYALRLRSLTLPQTSQVPLPAELRIRQRIDFEAQHDGLWQSLPAAVLRQIDEAELSAIIKFGMGLLRVPDELPCPILSYHHGDPRQFRGRPAGFYEILTGERRMGQVVQILSNTLDGGTVVAFAETAVRAHSYRATMEEAYRCSPLLLPKALKNALAGTSFPMEPRGRNYRLPSNRTVLSFLARTSAASLRRLAYGAFLEKRWQVASVHCTGLTPDKLVTQFPAESEWTVFPAPDAYRFVADPFPHPQTEGVLVEGLRKTDAQGEIVHLSSEAPAILCSGNGHFSYPSTIQAGSDFFLIPEVSEWSEQRVYRLRDGGVEEAAPLKVEGSPRLIDPTLYSAPDKTIYLFANVNDGSAGSGVLRLWVAPDLFGTFREHPCSPICMSPAGARMAGAILNSEGKLYRFGQGGGSGYGDGAVMFAITELSTSGYREEEIGRIRFANVRGPHTLNFKGKTLYFDFYRDRFTPLAGVRRMRSRLVKRRARAAQTI